MSRQSREILKGTFLGHPVNDDHHIDVDDDGALDKRIIKRVAEII